MNLNKQQISAITDKIYSEIAKEKRELKEKAISLWKSENQRLIDLELKKFSSVFRLLKSGDINSVTFKNFKAASSREKIEEIVVNILIERELDIKSYQVTPQMKTLISQEIILSTIDSKNLDELINNVKSKFV